MQSISFLEPHTILVLGCLGIAQALFLTVYLLTLKTGNRQANVLLGFVLLGLTIRIGKAVIFNYTYLGPWARNLGISGFLIVGPFLWFYGRTLLEKENTPNVKTFLTGNFAHLIPFLLFVTFSKIIPNNGELISLIPYTLVLLHLALYLGWCWHLIYRVQNQAPGRLVLWYRGITTGVTLILAMYVGIFIDVVPFYLLGATSFSFLIYLFSFLFLKKHQFTLEKYAQNSIDFEKSKALTRRVKNLFDAEGTYLKSNVSLNDVAEQLGVKPRILSQAINENEEMNFSEFVNHYRINHAKTLLVAPARKNDKIATIAFDCGFGNVTSFNVEFKSRVKITPSQFRKQFTTV